MASFSEFVRFCSVRTGCDKGGLYAIQPRGLRGSPIKIGYSFNLLRRLSDWEYNYPEGIDILAVARMNRPNDTHFHKRRALQLAEDREHIVAREEWAQPWAKAATLAATRPLQHSLSPNLAFFWMRRKSRQDLKRGRAHMLSRQHLSMSPRGVNGASPRCQCFGPATFGTRAWSRSARRTPCAAGSGRRVPVGEASAWRLECLLGTHSRFSLSRKACANKCEYAAP